MGTAVDDTYLYQIAETCIAKIVPAADNVQSTIGRSRFVTGAWMGDDQRHGTRENEESK